MFTSRTEETPDPDKAAGKDVIETRDAPVVFHENSEDSDDQDDDNHGYEMIAQDDDGEEQEEEDQHETSHSIEVADLVRAAQAHTENLTEATREMIDRASETQRAEQLAESAHVWTNSEARENSIILNDEKIATIKTIMSEVKLLGVPNWTNDLNFDDLKGKSQKSSEKPS